MARHRSKELSEVALSSYYNPMRITRLAAKQKRLRDWRDFLPSVRDGALRTTIESRLAQYGAVLAQCWETGTVDPAQESTIVDLERQLEQLNDEVRLRAGTHAQ